MSRPGASTAHTPAGPLPVTHWLTWRHVRLKLLETPGYLTSDQTHLDIHVIAARDTPVPITATGYLSHFIATHALNEAGGAVPYLTAWLDREALTRAYQRAEFLWRQGDLLDPLALEDDRDA